MSHQHVRSEVSARRRSRLIGFIIVEVLAIVVLLLSGAFALSSSPPTDSVWATSVNILTIAAAVAVAIFPIIFFAMAPVLPPGDR